VEKLNNRILDLINPSEQIPLSNGKFYSYLNSIPTRINQEYFPFAFEYKISAKNKKRVTINLINSIYQHYLIHGVLPFKRELFAQHPLELCARPCNFTVAIFIVQKLIADDLNLIS
jgi:hypothetical protein